MLTGPLHNVGHLLGNTETLIEKSDMDDDTKKKLSEAIEQLFSSYGAVDEKMHNAEKGKDYSDVSEQIDNAINALKAQANISKGIARHVNYQAYLSDFIPRLSSP